MNKQICFPLLLTLVLAACGGTERSDHSEDSHGEASESAFERGPHRGRMLRNGDFAIEVTIFETGVPPQFRLYAYLDGKPLKPQDVEASIHLHRLDGEINRYSFKAENDYLTGNGTVVEPHSFDVKVTVRHAGKAHAWEYDSYEGRTTIPEKTAADAGIKIERAGPATIRDTLQLMGKVSLNANRHAQVRARFPGIVRAVNVQQGDRVRRGQTLLVVEGNESMRTYPVAAPIDGVILVRNASVGDVADDNVLLEVADLSTVWVELHAIGRDAARLGSGQPVQVSSATGEIVQESVIDVLQPLATQGQSVVARASLPNPDGKWRPGMAVTAKVMVAERQVPIAVKESGLQRFRDFTVVFAKVRDTYEVRMLDLGDRDGVYVEVLGGIKPDTLYVAEQSYLIRADIEKSGASHDH